MTQSHERRATIVIGALLIAWSALAWIVTVRTAADMSGMALGLSQLGTRVPGAMSVPLFTGMWLTMMVAMMFPTMAPMVAAHRMVTSRRGEGWGSTLAFVVGYLVVWTLAGAVPFAALVAFGKLSAGHGGGSLAPLAGAILAAAGAYQFTPLKTVCLRACRTPIGFILSHDFRTGAAGAFRAGLVHGAFCLGCCWALMAILIVVGLMSLAWMAALSVVFLLEKNWRGGVALSRAVGVALVLAGVAVVVEPQFLPTLAGAGGAGPTAMSEMR
ncbi:MAG: DUF2182 domain-containing protein [Candidatus Velthaea sp.]